MKEINPGHIYAVEIYPAKELDRPYVKFDVDLIKFRKRIGVGYPGNTGVSMNGTSTQELYRVIISRTKYVDDQATQLEDFSSNMSNAIVLSSSRTALYALEDRAARRRGNDYLIQWLKDIQEWGDKTDRDGTKEHIEDIPPCEICGHIFCRLEHPRSS